MQTKWGNAILTKWGYWIVKSNEKGNRGKAVHVLVLEEKIGRPLNENECGHHIDGDKQNNDPVNLEVMDKAEHKSLHNTGKTLSEESRAKVSKAQLGENNSMAKLKEADVIMIKLMLKNHNYKGIIRDISRLYGVHASNISMIKSGRRWGSV
jgi:hypothetical protein